MEVLIKKFYKKKIRHILLYEHNYVKTGNLNNNFFVI